MLVKKLFPNKKIKMVLGGFHLFEYDDQAKKTIKYFKKEKIEKFYPCHCTCLNVKAAMINADLDVAEVGSGLEIEIK